MVAVSARRGTASMSGKWPFVDLLEPALPVQLDHLHVEGVVEVGHGRIVEGEMAVLPDAETAQVEGVGSTQEIGVTPALELGIGQPVDVVGLAGMDAVADALPDPPLEPGRVVGPHAHVLVHVEDHDVGPRDVGGGRSRARRRTPAGSSPWRTWRGRHHCAATASRSTAAARSAASRASAEESGWTSHAEVVDGPLTGLGHGRTVGEVPRPRAGAGSVGGGYRRLDGCEDHAGRRRKHPLDTEADGGLRQHPGAGRRRVGPLRPRPRLPAPGPQGRRARGRATGHPDHRPRHHRHRRRARRRRVRDRHLLGRRVRQHAPRHRDPVPATGYARPSATVSGPGGSPGRCAACP